MQLFHRFLLWPLFLVSHLLMVAVISWQLLARVDFLYPLAYQLLDIDQHIQTYGPQNRYKTGFEQTGTEEHYRLFHAINQAVHRQGDGLDDIYYTHVTGPQRLLRQAEIIHLRDVARLVDVFHYTAGGAALLWCLLFFHALHRRLRLPSYAKILGGFAKGLLATTLILVAAGPTRVFYGLHILVFPAEHEWFFYYEDSLMTTLMKAPDLFGVIAVFLLMLLICLWTLTLIFIARGLDYQHQRANSNPDTASAAHRKK